MAYKSLIDYYGGGMVKPSDGYRLGGLIAGAGRQREYSGEIRGLQKLAEQAAKRRKKLLGGGSSWMDKIKSFAKGTAATAIAGPAGAAAYKAYEQLQREKRFKETEFGGGKYAQDIREEFGKRESAVKKHGLERIGLAGIAGYAGGKAGGAFGKAVGGIKGGIGQIKDIAGFLKEGGTMGDVLGGYAQKIGESGVFGDSLISRGLLGAGAKAGIAPTVSASMKKTLSDEGRQKAFTDYASSMAQTPTIAPAQDMAPERGTYESYKNIFSKRGQDVPLGREQYLETSGRIQALQQPTPDWSAIEQDRLAAVQSAGEAYGQRKEQYEWLKGRGVIEEPESPFTTEVEPLLADMSQGAIEEASPWMAQQQQQQQPVPSMAGSLMPDMPPAGFSGQDIMVGQEGPDAIFEPFMIPSLLGGEYPGYQPELGSYKEFASDWMPAGLQTAGGFGYNRQEGGLVDYMMPQGFQEGGYATATDPEGALRQMGMEKVADDPKLQQFIGDLPAFGMGYKQQLGDVRFQGQTGLMNVGSEGRLTRAKSGFAGGGAGSMIEAMQRRGVQRNFETGRRGVVEGYQADLLSAIADIEAKGGFEFGEGTTTTTTTLSEGEQQYQAQDEWYQMGFPDQDSWQRWVDAGSDQSRTGEFGGSSTAALENLSGTVGLSDVRTKSNIDYLFSLDNGIPIYLFKYIGSDELNIGTIAQEAEKIIPEAVIEDADGIKYVNYDIIYRQGV